MKEKSLAAINISQKSREEFVRVGILGKFSEKNVREESLIAINISHKLREEFLKGRFLKKDTRDSSQKWLKLEVYSPLIWGAKGEIFIPVNQV